MIPSCLLFIFQEVIDISDKERKLTLSLYFELYWFDCRVNKTSNRSSVIVNIEKDSIPIFKPGKFLSF